MAARIKWTKEAVLEDARRFSYRSEWKKHSETAYKVAVRNGWLVEATAHMDYLKLPNGTWTKNAIFNDAKRYNNRWEWGKNSESAYKTALDNGWIEEACAHMEWICQPNKWTKMSILAEAKRFQFRIEWKRESPISYEKACDNGWIEEAAAHMPKRMSTSLLEKEVQNIIKQQYPLSRDNFRMKSKSPIYNIIYGFELDIYIPELSKGVEFNGDYWHSEEGLKRGRPNWPDDLIKNYHSIKREFFKSQGIDYIEIWEHEWEADRLKCINKCLSFLNGELS